MSEPPEFIAVKFTDQFPVINVCVMLFVVPICSQAVTVRLFLPHFHDAGAFVDVSLNTIVNGVTPSHPRDVLLVATDMFLEVNDAPGVMLRLNSRCAPTLEAECDAS